MVRFAGEELLEPLAMSFTVVRRHVVARNTTGFQRLGVMTEKRWIIIDELTHPSKPICSRRCAMPT